MYKRSDMTRLHQDLETQTLPVLKGFHKWLKLARWKSRKHVLPEGTTVSQLQLICYLGGMGRSHKFIFLCEMLFVNHIHARTTWAKKKNFFFKFCLEVMKSICLSVSLEFVISSVQFDSVAQSCLTLCDSMDCSMPAFPVHHQLPELAQTHVHRVSDAIHHLILCCPLLLPSSIFPSIRVFSNDSVLCIRWPKYWSFSFSISPSNEYSGLISFRMDWLDLLLRSYFNDIIYVFIYLQRGIY